MIAVKKIIYSRLKFKSIICNAYKSFESLYIHQTEKYLVYSWFQCLILYNEYTLQVTGNSTFVVNSFKRMVVKGWQKIRTIMLYIPAKKKIVTIKQQKRIQQLFRVFLRDVCGKLIASSLSGELLKMSMIDTKVPSKCN